MRFAGFALLAFLPSALEAAAILSLGQFKTEYHAAVTDGFGVANEGIMGASEPPSHLALWAWYRNVDASTQAEAKAFMDAKVGAHTSSSAVTITDFATKYTTALGGAITKTNVGDKVIIMRQVMAATRPAAGAARTAWDAYQLLNAADKAAVKDAVMYKPFIDVFTTTWDTQWAAAATWKARTKLAAGTMGAAHTSAVTGQDTFEFWKAMAEADEREALQKVMFSGTKSFANLL